MLSNPIHNNPPSALQTRQRLHRRQRSTPTAFETMKMTTGNLPTTPAAMQQHQSAQAQAQAQAQVQAHAQVQSQHAQRQQPARQLGHRRGQSLDTRRQQIQQRQQRQQQIQQMQHHQHQQQLMAAAVAASAGVNNGTNNALRQDMNKMVGNLNATNQGTPTTTQQHVMRETQQQRTVRQGGNGQPIIKQSREEAYLLAAQRQQQQQQQQQDCVTTPFDFYNGPAAVMMRKSLSGGGLPVNQQDFQLFGNPDQNGFDATNAFINFQDGNISGAVALPAGSPQGWASEDETSSTRRTSRRVSNGIMDRVAKFESLNMDGMPRPATPPHQNDNAYFPPTPTETPHERMAKLEGRARLDRFSDDYDESMEETIKPLRNRGSHSNRSSGIFDEMRQQAEAASAMATPPRSNMMQVPLNPADFMNMSNINTEFIKIQNGSFVTIPVPVDVQHLSPPLSQHPTPATVQGVFDSGAMGPVTAGNPNVFDNKPDLWATEYDSQSTISPFGGVHADSPSYSETPVPSRRRSPHRRNESIASIASAASIASINIEETRTETGVTLDDIAAYIDGPNPVDGKWRCLYEGCDKRFGRKENIKSHVQTHLNDRQYQCPHCQKCFVRQHDLKRHAKIHTGIKPYPCECGNNFARHDALTRHRQRGMCIGAFDGAVRKVGKRGRPRKARPNLESRLEKSARTRSKNKAASAGGEVQPSSPEASSHSGYSDSSAVNSPRTDDSDNPLDDEPFDAMDEDMLDMGFGETSGSAQGDSSSSTMNPSALAVSSAPMPGAGISAAEMVKIMPVVSPSEHAAALAASPGAMSHYSHVSRASLHGSGGNETLHDNGAEADGDDLLPANHPASPAKSVASHYTHHPTTPPELSSSSSPPHTSSSRFFDLDPNSSCTEEDSIGLSAPLTSGCGSLGMDVSGLSSSSLDDDIMLMKAFTTDDVLVQLDNSGLSMLNTSKFDDEYGMFSNSDDVFFGN